MARVNYHGWDLPDGAEVPDVPADLRRVVDGTIAQIPPRAFYMSRITGINSNAAVTATLLTMPWNETRAGLLTVHIEVSPVPWNVNTVGAVSIWAALEYPRGTQTQTSTGNAPASGWVTAAAPGPSVRPFISHDVAFNIPAAMGDANLKAYGVMNTNVGWPTGAICDWQRGTMVAAFIPTHPRSRWCDHGNAHGNRTPARIHRVPIPR